VNLPCRIQSKTRGISWSALTLIHPNNTCVAFTRLASSIERDLIGEDDDDDDDDDDVVVVVGVGVGVGVEGEIFS